MSDLEPEIVIKHHPAGKLHPCKCIPQFIFAVSLLQAAHAVGYGDVSNEAMLEAAKVPEGRYSHFVELHIEQVMSFGL